MRLGTVRSALASRSPQSVRHLLRVEVEGRSRWTGSPGARRLREYEAAFGRMVQTGPFEGLQYPRFWGGMARDIGAKLAGSYENALHSALEEALRARPEAVVDIGSAEGYYAIGCARRLPAAPVFAIDIDYSARVLCRRLARLNRVEQRVHVIDRLDRGALSDDASCLFIFDCEGAEALLLDPERYPQLRRSRVIAEMHEFIEPGVTDLCVSRLHDTHDVEVVEEDPELARQASVPAAWTDEQRDAFLSEHRPIRMHWLVAVPRSN